MPACKLATEAARDVPESTMLVTMARNGSDFGIQTSGTGDQWFTEPANTRRVCSWAPTGRRTPNPTSATRRLGDHGDGRHRRLRHGHGPGCFAMAAAPAIVRFVGGDVPMALRGEPHDARDHAGEHPAYQVPILEFRGPQRESTSRESCAQASCPRSTPVWRGQSPAPVRSAPAWSPRPSSASPPHWRRWRRPCQTCAEPGAPTGLTCPTALLGSSVGQFSRAVQSGRSVGVSMSVHEPRSAHSTSVTRCGWSRSHPRDPSSPATVRATSAQTSRVSPTGVRALPS